MPFFAIGPAMRLAQKQNLHWLITRAVSYAMRAGHYWLGLRKLHTGQPAVTAPEIKFHPLDGHSRTRTTASVIDPEKASASSNLYQELLRGYRPDIRKNDMGQEAKATLRFEPWQKICYYPGKIHGGYQSFLMDQLFADCCQPAVTANLTMSFLRPLPPDSEILLEVWPVEIKGREINMEGSVQISEPYSGRKVLAARATALFILPRPCSNERDSKATDDGGIFSAA
ncbi:HotDog domain-containing protein [Penicillium atrosanguineum]|nr:HotDog domain-containing protein [Penicillium atrosanguineum]